MQGCRRGTSEWPGPAQRWWVRRLSIEPRWSPERAAARREPTIRRARQVRSPARLGVQCWARVILCFCFLGAVLAARHGLAQTAQISPAVVPSAPASPVTTDTANRPAQPSPPLVPGASLSQAPVITPLTNPAVISPQAQLDYDLQLPLFGDLPLRKKLAEDGIDFIAHYISQTASNTSGVHGTGTAYAQQVDFGVSFDLDKLGVWPDAIARYAMTDRAGRNLTDRTGGYFPYQSIFGQGQICASTRSASRNFSTRRNSL